MKTLVPLLKNYYSSIELGFYNADLSDNEIEIFRIYLQAIPLSERFAFGLKHISQQTREMIKEINIFSFWVNEDEIVYLSVGTSDVLYATKFPIDDLVNIKPKQGKITIRDIEEAKINDACYASCFTEDTQSTRPAMLHEYNISDKNEFVGLIHDDAHRHFACATPKLIRKILWHIVDILRQQTGVEFSKEIWMFFDLAIATQIKYRTKTLEENGKEQVLCTVIHDLANESGFFMGKPHYGYFLLIMYLIAIDILKNKNIWTDKYGLDINKCQTSGQTDDFGAACMFVAENQSYIENSEITSALLKLYLFNENVLTMLHTSKDELSKLVDEAEGAENLNLSFKKTNKEDHYEKNRILFCLNDSPLMTHSCYEIKQQLTDLTQQTEFRP